MLQPHDAHRNMGKKFQEIPKFPEIPYFPDDNRQNTPFLHTFLISNIAFIRFTSLIFRDNFIDNPLSLVVGSASNLLSSTLNIRINHAHIRVL